MSFSDKIAIVALLVSGSGFTIKGTFLYLKTKTDKAKTIFRNPYVRTFLGVAIISALIAFVPWEKIHYGEQKPKTVYMPAPVKKTDTVKNSSIKVQKETVYIAPKKTKTRSIIKPVVETKNDIDTTTKPSKYDLSHATVTQSAVGDNASVTNKIYGPKQREATNDIVNLIVSHIPNKKIYVSLERRTVDEETLKYASSIMKALNERGYKNVYVLTIAPLGLNDTIYLDNPELTLKQEKSFQFSVEPDQIHVCIPIHN